MSTFIRWTYAVTPILTLQCTLILIFLLITLRIPHPSPSTIWWLRGIGGHQLLTRPVVMLTGSLILLIDLIH